MSRTALAVALAALVNPALAADMPAHKEVAQAVLPISEWSGAYVGMNAGYGWGTTTGASTYGVPLADPSYSTTFGNPWGYTALANNGNAGVAQSGFVAGGQVGYNYQINPTLLAGAEVDFQGTGIQGSGDYTGLAVFNGYHHINGVPAHPVTSIQSSIGRVDGGLDWLGTVRGRIGYILAPSLLIYATGGLAYGSTWSRINNSMADVVVMHEMPGRDEPISQTPNPGTGYSSQTQVGWTVGGGSEWRFDNNWSVKTEALYYNLGSHTTYASPNIAKGYDNEDALVGVGYINSAATKLRYDGIIARAGINYHFNLNSDGSAIKF